MEAGQDAAAFWDTSFVEYKAVIAGAGKRNQRERERELSLAWHVAALQRQKRLPAHDKVVKGSGRRERDLSPDQLEAQVRGWFRNRRKRAASNPAE